MIRLRRVAIAGLGLIGGSLARDLAAAGVEIIASDPDPASREAAQQAGVISRASADLESFDEADAIVVATPADRLGPILESLASRSLSAALITDTGGTKVAPRDRARELGLEKRFVGSHPFTGDHRSGWEASRHGLFREARVFLSPSEASSPEAITLAAALWSAVGARPEIVSPEAHDRLMAFASHLPQIVSTALGSTLGRAVIPRSDLGPGGRDVTRLAASSPEVWTPLSLENAAYLSEALRLFQTELDAAITALEEEDATALRKLFERAQRWAASDPGRG